MAATWEYKVLSVKHAGGAFTLTQTPTDDEAAAALNREGALGWELVNAICPGISQPLMLYLKRLR